MDFSAFRMTVNAVENAGGTIPDAYSQTLTKWENFRNTGTPNTDRLAAAMADPKATDLSELRALAIAEHAAITQIGAVNVALEPIVFQQLKDAYATVARSNYDTIADKFNTAAKTLTDAVAAVNVEATGDEAITWDTKRQQHWSKASLAATELDRVVPQLQAAASLLGIVTARVEEQLALTCQPGNLHRRRVWEAWENNDGRTGRWGKLASLGVTIGAADPDNHASYHQPRPMETRQERTTNEGFGGVRMVQYDPEDNPNATPRDTSSDMLVLR